MRQGSFTAHMPCFVLSYTDDAGFTSSRPDDALADDLKARRRSRRRSQRGPRPRPRANFHAARAPRSRGPRADPARGPRRESRRRAPSRARRGPRASSPMSAPADIVEGVEFRFV